jgi:hypothetical protein
LIKNQSTIGMEEFIRVQDARLYACHDKIVAQETKGQIENLTKWFDVSKSSFLLDLCVEWS